MEILICARQECYDRMFMFVPTDVLSLVDPAADLSRVKSAAEHHKVNWKTLRFRDTESPNYPNSPTKELCAEILDWSKDFNFDTRLLIHCEAGISRSTSSALAIYIQWQLPSEDINEVVRNAANYITRIRPIASPNLLMAGFYDDLLHCEGKLVAQVRRMRYISSERYMIRL
jgi:predicted protein tyrosine phosphatase